MEIKTLQPLNGGHHSYGHEYEVRVSDSTALSLAHSMLGSAHLPSIGYGTSLVRATRAGFSEHSDRLLLENRGGSYFVCCITATIGEWPALFDVTVT